MERFLLAPRLAASEASRRCTPASSARRGACGDRRAATCRAGIETERARAHDHHPPDPSGRGFPAQADHAPSPSVVPADSPAAVPRGARRRPVPGPYRVVAWDAAARRDVRAQPATSGLIPRARAGRASPTGSRCACTATRTIERRDRRRAARRRGSRGPRRPVRQRWSRAGRLRALVGALARAGAERPGADHGVDLPQHATRRRSTTSACGARSTSRSTARRSSRSSGGPRGREPTCQVVPAASRATARTARTRPSPARARLDRARHGAGAPARRGLRHARASVSSSGYRTSVRRSAGYVAKVLDELGFRGLAVDGCWSFDDAERRPLGAPIGFTGWLARLPRRVDVHRAGVHVSRA